MFIFDTRGFVLDAVDVPTNGNEVYQRLSDGSFEKSDYYSRLSQHPGRSPAYLSQFVFDTGDLRSTSSCPPPCLRDEDGDLSD